VWVVGLPERSAGNLRLAALAVLAIAALGACCSYAEKSLTDHTGSRCCTRCGGTLYAQRFSGFRWPTATPADRRSDSARDRRHRFGSEFFLASGLLGALVSMP